MPSFNYLDGQLHAEGVSLAGLAGSYGTPCYVYSRTAILDHWQEFEHALSGTDHLICYSVKSNSNIAILNLLANQGAGFDIVSVGELERVLAAHGDPGKVVFSGVGKRTDEMKRALETGIKCFNIESLSELQLLDNVAADMGKIAPVSVRVNPDVDARTHPYIATGLKQNKFGIAFNEALSVYQKATRLPHIKIEGIDCHIGSQITSLEPFRDALEKLTGLIKEIEATGIKIGHVDIGGGLGIRYQDETPPAIADYISTVREIFPGSSCQIIIEPGRSIMGNAGILLTRVLYLKHTEDKNFAIVDAAMTELLRPALYNSWHEVLPVNESANEPGIVYDLVGPVCESADFLARNRTLSLVEGDLVALLSTGAYGFSMASTYNSRPRCCELLVDGDKINVIRSRETVEVLMAGESLVPDN